MPGPSSLSRSGRLPSGAGLRVLLSDRVERLWEALAERVQERRDPFEKLVVAMPSRVVERRAELAVARALGIAAALDLTRLPSVLEARVSAASGKTVLSSAMCEALVRDVLLTPERLEADALEPVRRYVNGEPGSLRSLRERRACELAVRLARLYGSYTHDRPELVLEWLRGEPGPSALAAWQGALLREALAPFDGQLVTMTEGIAPLRAADADATLVVLGYSYLTRLELTLLGAIARRSEVLVLTPTPCAEFWEDATRRAAEESRESESTLLASWGTAAREHVAALDAATEYATDRDFAESDETTRLGRLQASIRERRAVKLVSASPRDDSLVLIGAPSLRREVEVVAGQIWARVHRAAATDSPLRFPDIAVWVPTHDRDLYLPQIETVFAEAHDIPWSGVDLALASRSRVVEALVRIVTLVAQGPTRAGLLDVLLHPLVLARVPGEPSTDAIALAIERLGVFFGSDARELPAAYAADPRSIDLGQAIERMALGEVMLGERSGEDRFFERIVQGELARWLPEELDLDGGASSFIALVRSLASDLASARSASLPLEAWARFFVALGETYVVPDAFEQAEHRRALLALRALGGPTFDGPSLSGGAELACGAACELALRTLEGLPAARGASDRGVLVGALGPHRASDHRLVFVLGLGEGRFPSREADTGLDLRTGERRACEVSAEDRDRLALLETVVSAREALLVSWVARDDQTGDDIAPSHAVAELRAAAREELVVERPPLRRDTALLDAAARGDADRTIAALSFPIAAAEARARTLGDAERAHWAQSPTPLADLARELAPDDTRRTLLALEPIPSRPPTDALTPVRVSLDEIRRFLDCPVQGAARRIVGRADDDEGPSTEAEPFDLDERAHADLVRALVLGSLGAGEASVDTLAARRAAHGAFPLGAFGERARTLATDEARRLTEAVRRARPRARAIGGARFGAGREHGESASRALDPIALGTLPDGRPIELVGTTAPLLVTDDTEGEEPLRIDLSSAKVSERKLVAELRLALHAFVDHAAMSLGGPPNTRSRRALVVARGPSTEILLAPLRAELARRWLAGLAKEIAVDVQTSFMPIESVLRVGYLFAGGSATLERDLVRSIEVVRGPKWEGGRSRFGPVRDAVRLPAPSAPARLAGQRFSIFFAHLRAPLAVAPTRGGR